jgi:hypothetical protein
LIAEAALTEVEKRRKRQSERSREQFAKASDIGEIPPVVNMTRRRACKYDLHLFEQTYFPHSTGLAPFGSAQTNVLERIQGAITGSGRVLNCEPRGFAKSTKSENAIIWAALYGHRSYAVLFGATGDDASDAIGSIKSELQENDLLMDDFPEVCHPIRKLEGRPQRCLTQTHKGKLTHIGWTADAIVLPTIEGSPASGSIIRSKGYTAASRGMRFKRPDGKQLRPDLVIIDDPQTDESAMSPTQVAKRMNTLQKSILRLGGHGQKVAAVMNATVIADGDMVDQLADHKLHPEWQAVRVKMLEEMPKAIETHWLTKYKQIRDDYDPDVIGEQRKAHERATQYYLDNREVMDEGAQVAWHFIPLEDGEVSAIQHAMNILCDDGEALAKSVRTKFASGLADLIGTSFRTTRQPSLHTATSTMQFCIGPWPQSKMTLQARSSTMEHSQSNRCRTSPCTISKRNCKTSQKRKAPRKQSFSVFSMLRMRSDRKCTQRQMARLCN